MNTYNLGDLVRCSGSIRNTSDTLVDPTTVIFKVKNPIGKLTTYTYGVDGALVKDSVGNYHVDVSATITGTWMYQFRSTGTGQAASESEFAVRSSNF